MNRELQRWALILAGVIPILATLGAFIPQWIYIQPNQYTFGLRQMCHNGYCGGANWYILEFSADCKNGCQSNSFIRRWRAVEAWIWTAAATSALAIPIIWNGFRRDLLHTARVMGPLAATQGFAVFSFVSALAIFGSTVDLHNYDYDCPLATGCLFWGASSIAAQVGLYLIFLALVLTLVSLPFGNPRFRAALLAWGIGLSFAATLFAIGAALSNRWVIVSYPYQNLENYKSLAPINSCSGGSCYPTNQTEVLYPYPQTNSTCGTEDGLKGRFGVGTALLEAGALTSLASLLTIWWNWPVWSFILQGATLGLIVSGIAVTFDTWDWYLQCGMNYCDWVTLQTGYDCNYGLAPAFAIPAAVLSGLLLTLFLFMWCCRKIDRAPDTQQVAVTTIAQPLPAPPQQPIGPL